MKTLEKSGLEPTAPNRLADRKHTAISTQIHKLYGPLIKFPGLQNIFFQIKNQPPTKCRNHHLRNLFKSSILIIFRIIQLVLSKKIEPDDRPWAVTLRVCYIVLSKIKRRSMASLPRLPGSWRIVGFSFFFLILFRKTSLRAMPKGNAGNSNKCSVTFSQPRVDPVYCSADLAKLRKYLWVGRSENRNIWHYLSRFFFFFFQIVWLYWSTSRVSKVFVEQQSWHLL